MIGWIPNYSGPSLCTYHFVPWNHFIIWSDNFVKGLWFSSVGDGFLKQGGCRIWYPHSWDTWEFLVLIYERQLKKMIKPIQKPIAILKNHNWLKQSFWRVDRKSLRNIQDWFRPFSIIHRRFPSIDSSIDSLIRR